MGLEEGDVVEVRGSAAEPYKVRRDGDVYSCTCPAWRNQGNALDRRTCKHLRALRGDAEEAARTGGTASPPKPAGAKAEGPPLLLAHRWEDQDPTGWWMSEKLDGVRAWWDGKRFVSRLGNPFHAPGAFTEGLPDEVLDGELFGGRKRFQQTVSLVRSSSAADWSVLRFEIFDAPNAPGGFEERVAHVVRTVASIREARPDARVTAHEHVACTGIEHLRTELARVEALGGEGLMLRRPGSRYEVGRSTTLLKVKSFVDDEARVVGHTAGAGKHKGKVGALVVENAAGVRFNVGTGLSDRERVDPPPIGAVVTVRYQELTDAGVPRFPTYVGVRDDVTMPEPAAKAAPAPAPTGPAPTAVRTQGRYELVEGTSSKFWAIGREGAKVTVTYGRIGTTGQSKTREHDTEAAAIREVETLTAEKTRKGYSPV